MKAIMIDNYGSRQELKEKEIDTPSINESQVLVELYATSINPIDWKVREGYLKEMLPFDFPIILGWDAAGVVTETGSRVTNFKVGDRVFSRPDTTREGTYAEYAAVDSHLLAHMPEEMSFEEAAAIPLAGLTAWQCLTEFKSIKEGGHVLIHAGAGGVGNFAIQIAKNMGAYVTTTASGKNADFLYSLGADNVIDYKNEDFSETLSNVDFVLDAVGGEVQSKSYRVLKQDGTLVSIVEPPSEEEAGTHNVHAHFHWLEPDGGQLQKLADLYEQEKVKPVVGTTFDFNEKSLQEAHALSESTHARGKIVIQIKK
ncbi:NADP-dependent oxidoreductase [Salipaludibacillus aurantiacus]|uniref:NADPH:quinone reductase n=1 Tax=Salipaludibacillus aurantiacus TaxID=1601833 RepID=A0A1H9SA21_9BACI|nr:NADP-dependent oxidoreductase [Salipaludibacillus aurantiacus]SER81223.1 NADPH:quinone reductase [Salipaludibacillus aurantiacus]